MRGLTLSAIAGAGLATGALAQASSSCADGLYMIVARGSDEPPGMGVTGLVADAVAKQIPGSKAIGLDYPASFSNYIPSEEDGARAMRTAISDYQSQCPNSLMAILGYSQGAQVVSDAVCGTSEIDFSSLTPVPMDVVEDNIVAMVIFGDPSHVANTTYDRGTATHNGIFVRNNLTLCDDYTNELISYCDQGDIYCDSGDNTTVHGTYVEKYGSQMEDYIVSKYNAKIKTSGGGNSTTTSTSTSTSAGVGGSATASTTAASGSSTSGASSSSSTSSAPTTVPTGAAAGLLIPGSTVLLSTALLGLFSMLL